jgi:hypothetical protein
MLYYTYSPCCFVVTSVCLAPRVASCCFLGYILNTINILILRISPDSLHQIGLRTFPAPEAGECLELILLRHECEGRFYLEKLCNWGYFWKCRNKSAEVTKDRGMLCDVLEYLGWKICVVWARAELEKWWHCSESGHHCRVCKIVCWERERQKYLRISCIVPGFETQFLRNAKLGVSMCVRSTCIVLSRWDKGDMRT